MKSLIYLLIAFFITALFSCEENDEVPGNNGVIEDRIIHINVLYTNDEHGWMEATNDYDGAAGLMNLWKKAEGYDGSDNYLILSGGDMWSGPAISTWFQGESMVEVMNAMGYDAAAIGNHEFDFTVDVLNNRLYEQNFPLLSANIKNISTGEIPGFAKPYIIKEIDGIKVGIIGLSSLSTPSSTFPANVADYEFTSYAEAIEEYSMKAKNEGAVVLILIGHLCKYEMENLVSVAKSNDICLIGGGHCNKTFADEKNGVLLIKVGKNMKAYVKVEFDYNVTDALTENFEYYIVENNKGEADSEIQEIVNYWSEQTKEELSETIGYTEEIIFQSSVEMGNMVCDSWLYTFPYVDVSLTNSGGIRQDIPQGNITLETVVGLLPFENNILELELTGAELIDVADGLLMGGMKIINGDYFLMNGDPIDNNAIYKVLTTDYLYSLNDNKFSEYDNDPLNTYVHYRQPLIDWFKFINTNSSNPLSNYLDNTPRF